MTNKIKRRRSVRISVKAVLWKSVISSCGQHFLVINLYRTGRSVSCAADPSGRTDGRKWVELLHCPIERERDREIERERERERDIKRMKQQTLTAARLQLLWQIVYDEPKTLREPWSSGYGGRFMLWVRIPVLYTLWTFFTYICCKNCNDVCLKRPKINDKRDRGLA